MSSYKISGIIIKRSNFGEADRLITLFSPHDGKCQLLAKGARRPSARLAAVVNLFDEMQFVAIKTRSIDIVEEASIIRHRGAFESNLKAVKYAFQMAELIDQMLRTSDPFPSIFKLFRQLLDRMETDPREWLVDYFYMQTLMASGFTPELSHCTVCGRTLPADAELVFGVDVGGVAERRCADRAVGEPIDQRAIKWLRLLTADMATLEKVKISHDLERIGHRLVSNFTSGILQRELKSDKI